jgi:hypothetical protein
VTPLSTKKNNKTHSFWMDSSNGLSLFHNGQSQRAGDTGHVFLAHLIAQFKRSEVPFEDWTVRQKKIAHMFHALSPNTTNGLGAFS